MWEALFLGLFWYTATPEHLIIYNQNGNEDGSALRSLVESQPVERMGFTTVKLTALELFTCSLPYMLVEMHHVARGTNSFVVRLPH